MAHNQSKQGYEEVMEYVIRDTGLSAAQIEQLRKAVEAKMPAEDVLEMARNRKDVMEIRRCIEFYEMMEKEQEPQEKAKKNRRATQMSEELQSLVQIIELYGRVLGGLGKAIRFSAKGAAKGVQIAQVKALQHRMKLHYASEGTHNTMKLSDLEKMTGGRYTILNIPLEGEKELIPFYDRLKKMKVAFAELPDLNLGRRLYTDRIQSGAGGERAYGH